MTDYSQHNMSNDKKMYKGDPMTLQTIPTGRLDGRSYLIASGTDAAVVDPDINVAALLAALQEGGLTLRYILLTHCHFDHTAGVAELKRLTGAAVCVHELDADGLCDGRRNATEVFGQPPVTGIAADRLLKESDRLPLGEEEITVLHTPGHTPGGACFLAGGNLLTGDTLFRGTYGITQCFGGNFDHMKESLHRLFGLQGDLIVWPGHGQPTTIERERGHNLICQ